METVVGPSVKVQGDFISQGNIVIEGEVKGSIKTDKHLRVEEGAKIDADVSAESALLAGEVRGNIHILGTAELTPTAKLYGDLEAKTLIVAAGAVLHGRVMMDEKETEKGRGKSKSKVDSNDQVVA